MVSFMEDLFLKTEIDSLMGGSEALKFFSYPIPVKITFLESEEVIIILLAGLLQATWEILMSREHP